ncbi:MAG: OmpA family protein [Neomegalonema sp.]|nr:OmpA family protein [Neomegalonema sp.]
MRRSEIIGLLSFAIIGIAALGLGRYVAGTIENKSIEAARLKLDEIGFPEIGVAADGAVLALSGRVQSARDHRVILRSFEELKAKPAVVDNIVVVAPLVDLQPAILHIHKDTRTLTLSGDAPNSEARDLLGARAEFGAGALAFLNVMDTQQRRAEDQWMRAAEAAIDAVGKLRTARATVEPGLVRLAGAAIDADRKAEVEKALKAAIDPAFKLKLDIASPPPLLAPYVFAARKSEQGFEISTCAAPDAAQRSVILGALRARDLLSERRRAEACIIANGAPNGDWAQAVERAIDVLGPLVEGEVRIVDDAIELFGYVSRESEIERAKKASSERWPAAYSVRVDIRKVLPVVRPFTLTAVKTPGVVRLSGHAPSRDRSEAWATKLDATNTLALARGAPAEWAQAATVMIDALAELKVGAVTLADRSFRLAAPGDASERAKLEVRLKKALPKSYRLTVVEAKAPSDRAETAADKVLRDTGPVDNSSYFFVAQRLPNGDVTVRGVAPDKTSETVIAVYARAKVKSLSFKATLVAGRGAAPESWQLAIFAGLEALGQLDSGSLRVEPGAIILRGKTQGAIDARRAGAALAEKAPKSFARFSRVEIVETRPKKDGEKGPDLASKPCVDALNKDVKKNPVRFDSGSTAISSDSEAVLDVLAAIIRRCPAARIEVGGHTDSLGSAEGNAALSRDRAEAVRRALIARRAPRAQLTAKGYGPSEPVASNDTEEGREKNRRIEFKLLGSAD